MEPKKLVIFQFQVRHIDHKPCKGSKTLVIMTPGDSSTHNSNDVLKQINHFQWRQEVYPLNQFSYTKFIKISM